MIDYDNLSTEDLMALKKGDYDSLSTNTLLALKGATVQAQPEARTGEAAIQGFAQGATAGYLPQIQAATEPAIQGALGFFGDDTDAKLKEQGFNIQQPEQSYTQRRDQFIAQAKQLEEENPAASTIGQVLGGLSTALLPGTGAARAATGLGRLGQAAATGAAMGALRNPGDVEGEISPLQLEERGKNVLLDAATGAVFQGGVEGVGAFGKVLKGAGGKIADYAEDKILKAIGSAKKDFKSIEARGKASEITKTALDEGLVKIGDDIKDIAQKAEAAQETSKKALGKVYEKADEALEQSFGPVDFKPKVQNIIDAKKRELVSKYADHIEGDEIIDEVGKYLEKLEAKKDLTFGQLRKIRQSIDSKIKWTKLNGKDEFQQELRSLRNEIQDEIGQKLKALDPNLSNQFSTENKKLSNLIEIVDISDAKKAAEKTNASFGLRERLAGQSGTLVGTAVGSAIGGPVGAVVGAGVGSTLNSMTTKLARQYGTPFVAITANKIAKKLAANPRALGKFADPLIRAAEVSPERFVRTVNAIIKDPEYKKIEKGQFTRSSRD